MDEITNEDMIMVLEYFRMSASRYEKKVIDAIIERYLEDDDDE